MSNKLNGFIVFEGAYAHTTLNDVVQIDFYNMGDESMVSVIRKKDESIVKHNYPMNEISQMTFCVKKGEIDEI